MTMQTTYKRSYITVPANDVQKKWLKDVLEDAGEVLETDTSSVERVTQLVDLSGAQIILVGLTQDNLQKACLFMEELITLKPMLLIIAVTENSDSSLLLNAVRAGARDIIFSGAPQLEARRQIEKLHIKAPTAYNNNSQSGKITSVISARPNDDTPMLSLHLALALQQSDENVLLMDLGIPAADTLSYLGINATYTFIDAIRSLRRLDATLIESAFAKHDSGIKLLAMPEEQIRISDIASADIFVLLGVLRQHFSHIIVNLGGVPYSNFLHLMLTNSEKILLDLEQSVPSCKQNMQLVKLISQGGIDMKKVKLIVDRYLPTLPPDAENLARGLDIELMGTLSSSGMARLKMMNSAESLFECAPRDPYTSAVKKIAQSIRTGEAQDATSSQSKTWANWMQSIKTMFGD